MSNVIRSLMVKVGTDLTDFDKGMKQMSRNLASTGKTLTSAGKGLTAGVTVPVVSAIAGLTSLTMKASENADEMLTLSAKTGIGVEALQEMKYASELVDVDLETMTGSMFKLGKSMDAARGGTGAQSDAFKALGISVTNSDGSLRDSKEVWYEAIDALGGITNETERNVMAQELFGKSFAELNPLVDAGSDALKGYMDEASEVGVVLSEEDMEALGKFDDTMQRLKATFAGVGAKIGVAFLPVLQSLLPIITDQVVPAIQKFADFVAKMSDKFANLSPEMQGFILKLLGIAVAAGPVLMGLGKVASGVSEGIKIFMSLKDAFGIVGGAFKSLGLIMMANPIILIIAGIALAAILIITHWEEVKGFFIALWEGIKGVFQGAWDAITGILTTVWNGISSVATTIWDGITSFFTTIWDSYTGFWGGVWNGIKSAGETIWGGISTAASTIWGGISTFFGGLWENWRTNATTTWSTISAGASTAWSTISSTFTTFGGTAKSSFISFCTAIGEKMGGLKTSIGTKMGEIGKSIGDFFGGLPAKMLKWGGEMISKFIKGLKSFKIPLPHFSITGSFSLKNGTIPKLGVSWYDKGGIFNKPSVIGVGEKRPEFVGALDDLKGIMRSVVNDTMGSNQINGNMGGASVISVSNPIYLDGNLITTATSRQQSSKNSSRSRANGVVIA